MNSSVFSVSYLCFTQRTQGIKSVFSVFTPFRVNTENTDYQHSFLTGRNIYYPRRVHGYC